MGPEEMDAVRDQIVRRETDLANDAFSMWYCEAYMGNKHADKLDKRDVACHAFLQGWNDGKLRARDLLTRFSIDDQNLVADKQRSYVSRVFATAFAAGAIFQTLLNHIIKSLLGMY